MTINLPNLQLLAALTDSSETVFDATVLDWQEIAPADTQRWSLVIGGVDFGGLLLSTVPGGTDDHGILIAGGQQLEINAQTHLVSVQKAWYNFGGKGATKVSVLSSVIKKQSLDISENGV